LGRALHKTPEGRFADVGAFADAFLAAGLPRRPPIAGNRAADGLLERLRGGEGLGGCLPEALAWIALRAAMVRHDADLLAVADLWVARSGKGWEARAIATAVARARSDAVDERKAVDDFMAAAQNTTDTVHHSPLLHAAHILQDADDPRLVAPVRRWAAERLRRLWATPGNDEIALHAALALGHAKVLAFPDDIRASLDRLQTGSVWLWALAHDAFPERGYVARALAADRPRDLLLRGFACLRLYRLTGDDRWTRAARRIVAVMHAAKPGAFATLLAVELEAPARARTPPFTVACDLRSRP
jgi:hypothetical protein